MTLARCQTFIKTALSLRLLREWLVGQDKDRERSLTNYRHGQNRLDLGENNLIYYQSDQSKIIRKKT